MALPDHNLVDFADTQVIWGEAGATGVTKTMSLDNLTNDAGRAGAEVDLGATQRMRYKFELRMETGTAPPATAQGYSLYLAWGDDGTTYPGGVTGSDAVWPTDGNEFEHSKQLEYVGSLRVTNDTNTVMVGDPFIVESKGRYLVPVIWNQSGQSIRDETVNTDNDSRIIMTPVDDQVDD